MVKCKDHLENEYKSIKEMLAQYGISYSNYKDRLRLGWNIERILTTPVYKQKKYIYDRDRLMAIARKDGVKYKSLQARIYKGKDAYTERQSVRKEATDHLGNKYGSISDMLKAYNVTYDSWYKGLKVGKTVADILEKRHNNDLPTVDHLGNKYVNFSVMCKAYGMHTSPVRGRLNRGWDIEKALTYPVRYKKRKGEP